MNTEHTERARLSLISAMIIFGTIGIFRRYISMPSSVLAVARGVIGTVFLLFMVKLGGMKLSWGIIRKNAIFLFLSGTFIGINWILLFEAYRYTSVATATLCYYMAPVFVTLASPFILQEKISLRKAVCIVTALIGMVLVSGIMKVGFSGISELRGVLLGLGAAFFYACVILLNKKMPDIGAYDKTIVQLAVAAAVLIPYTLLTEKLSELEVTPFAVIMLLIVGIVHTGAAYALYFGAMKDLKAQTIALFSYIDPIVAILLSALVLHEAMGIAEVIGAALVLCATMLSEISLKKRWR